VRVSAIIPTYNRSILALRAIESVLRQTVPVDEIIVVDDGSTDGTSDAILSRFGSSVVLIRQENGGVSAARTRGLQAARGEWIAFLDSDDLWLPTKLEAQFQALETLGDEFGACFTNCSYFGSVDNNGTVFEEAGLSVEGKFRALDNPSSYLIAGQGFEMPPLVLPSLLVRRSIVSAEGGFDSALALSEDLDLMFRISFRTRFCVVSEALVSIDRTPDLPRLTGMLADNDDGAYHCLELRFSKMLAKPELKDPVTRDMIERQLTALHYSWAVQRLKGLRPLAALKNIRSIRSMGSHYGEILGTLLTRASGKISRTLRPSALEG